MGAGRECKNTPMHFLHMHKAVNNTGFLSVSFHHQPGVYSICLFAFVHVNLYVCVTFPPSLRFIMPGDVDLDDLPYEDLLSDNEELEMKKEKENKKRQELLAKVDFSRYTACQSVV